MASSEADHFRCPREPGYVDLHPVTRTILNDPRTSPVSKYAAEGKWPVFAIRSKKIARGLVLALVAGCSSTPDAARQAAELDQRLNNSLSGEVQDNRLLITQLPAGAKLTLDSRLLFPAYSAQLDERGQQLLNSGDRGAVRRPQNTSCGRRLPGRPWRRVQLPAFRGAGEQHGSLFAGAGIRSRAIVGHQRFSACRRPGARELSSCGVERQYDRHDYYRRDDLRLPLSATILGPLARRGGPGGGYAPQPGAPFKVAAASGQYVASS